MERWLVMVTKRVKGRKVEVGRLEDLVDDTPTQATWVPDSTDVAWVLVGRSG